MPKRDKWRFLTTEVGRDKYTVPIYEASARNKCVPLLKTLMSSHCTNNCKFCSLRSERRVTRERWEPQELARVTMKVWKDRRITGLFLSSSVEKDPDTTVEREIETVRILRTMGFTAYCHLRLMPGVSKDLIKQAVELSDRVGINVEFPKAEYYDDMKIYLDFRQDIIKRIRLLAREVLKAQKEEKCKAGLDSQMVIGAADETDKEVLEVSDYLYNKFNARRVYFSAFEPVIGTPLEFRQPENKWREYRLYQSSFLIQKYGFRKNDFVLDDSDMLFVHIDPKVLIAKRQELLVDINSADFNELIKVPGIGIDTANRILECRGVGAKFKGIKDLRIVGVIVKRALPFVKINSSFQSKLFDFTT